MKFAMMIIMTVLLGGGVRYGQQYLMKGSGATGVEGAQLSSEESGLMGSIFQSGLRLVSGSASRKELASELSDKLYSGRADTETMAELGIEIVKPGGSPPAPSGEASAASSKPVAKLPEKKDAQVGVSPAEVAPSDRKAALLAQMWERAKVCSVELVLVPIVLLGMLVVHRVKLRRSRENDLLPAAIAIDTSSESEPFDMRNAVHSLNAEEFELLVALIYQRQGYRVSMSAAPGGGSGGDFMLVRKSERVLVQCKRLDLDHKVPVERVRKLHEALTDAGATRCMYVASCGFTWDSRNFAKSRGITLINARTLDALITVAREKPDEDLLAVSQWAPRLLGKVQMTKPLCPACEAPMDQLNVSSGPVWLCSERPGCRGRRSVRKFQKLPPASALEAEKQADEVSV